MTKLLISIPCYKRPDYVERLLDSIEEHWLTNFGSDHQLYCSVWYKGEAYDPKTRSWPQHWEVNEGEPLGWARAKNMAVDIGIQAFDPELIMLLDDDLIFLPETNLKPALQKCIEWDTGVVSFTRKIGPQVKPKSKFIEDATVYMGNGSVMRRSVWDSVGGVPDTVTEEWYFTLNAYLNGYRNYRSQEAVIFHDQGRAHGGIWQLVKDWEDKTIPDESLPKGCEFHEKHYLLSGRNIIWKIRGKFAGAAIDNPKVTKLSIAIHKKNRMWLNFNRLRRK